MIFQRFFILGFLVYMSYAYTADRQFAWEERPLWNPQESTEMSLSVPEKKVLLLFPRILYDWCVNHPKDFHTKELIKFAHEIKLPYEIQQRELVDFSVKYHSKNICENLNLSPQTSYIIISTCKAIVKKEPFNSAHFAMTYDKGNELKNKLILIRQMPKIMADLCALKPKNFHTNKLIKILFDKSRNKVKVPDNDCSMHDVTWYINYYTAHILREYPAYNTYVSPHTVAQMAQELRDLVFHNKNTSAQPYNKSLEIQNGLKIVQRFPERLSKICEWPWEYHQQKIISLAYLLENPTAEGPIRIFLESMYESTLENSYRPDVLYHIKQIIENTNEAEKLAEEFVAIFTKPKIPCLLPQETILSPVEQSVNDHEAAVSIIGACYTKIVNDCRIQNDSVQYKALIEPLLVCRDALVKEATSSGSQKIKELGDTEFINTQLQEVLPNCPICFELFSDHFNSALGGAQHVLPCKHSVCTQCVSGCKSKCPLCRAEF